MTTHRKSVLAVAGGRSRGFTLLELLVVIVLVGMAVGITAVNLGSSTGRTELEAQSRRIVALLRQSRHFAVTHNRIYRLELLGEEGSHRFAVSPEGDALDIPQDMALTVTSDDLSAAADAGAVFFYPDGSSSGGLLMLSSAAGERTIRINWLTGETLLDPE